MLGHAGDHRLERRIRILHLAGASVAFCCPLVVYAATACRTVYWGDTGEFLVAAIRLGIPHSPGTPLYPLLGRCFSLLSAQNPALAVNLASGFFSAVSSLLVYSTVIGLSRLEHGRSEYAPVVGGLVASLVWASTRSLWSYSTIAEVYTLQMVFVCALVYLAVRMQPGRSANSNLLPFFFFLYGLSLSNNITVLLLMPGFIILVWPVFRKVPVRFVVLSLVLFLLGTTVYFYMPVRSVHNPPVDWGNPETLRQFIWVISAREFARNMFALEYAAKGGLLNGIATYVRLLASDISLAGIALTLVGMVACFRSSRRVFIGLLVIYGTTLSYSFAFGADLELEAYLLPALLVLALFAGISAGWIAGLNHRLKVVLPLVLLTVPSGLFISHYGRMNLRNNRYAERVGRSLLTSMEPGALYFTDNTVDLFTTLYVQSVRNYREDIILIYMPYLKYEWYRDQLEEVSSLSLPAERDRWLDVMLLETSYYTPLNKSLFPAAVLLPDGIRFILATDSLTEDMIERAGVIPGDFGPPARDFDTRKHFAIVHSYMGEYFFLRGEYSSSARQYKAASEFLPGNCEVRENLASAQEKAGMLKEAFESYEVCIALCGEQVRPLKGLGRISLIQGDFGAAKMYLTDASYLDPDDASIYYNIGLAEMGSGNDSAAAAANLKAIALEPGFAEAMNNLGVSYLRMGRKTEAASFFSQAIAADSSFCQAYLNLAGVHASRDEMLKAGQVLRAGLRNCSQGADYHLFRSKLDELGKVGN